MPPVNVTSKYAKGINSLAELEGSQPMQAMPLDEAITTPFNTDAHFVTYRVPGATQIPRINKPALSSIREQGLDVVVDHIVLDYDNPGHGEWTKESLASFFKDFEQRCDELMGKWRVVYTTLHGARIIFELSEPIPADVAEPKIAGLIARFRAKGIEVDKLSDWTRLFRLPDVNRDGEQQGEAWWYLCAEQEQTVAADEIPSLGEVAEATEHVPLDVTMPDPDEAKELL